MKAWGFKTRLDIEDRKIIYRRIGKIKNGRYRFSLRSLCPSIGLSIGTLSKILKQGDSEGW